MKTILLADDEESIRRLLKTLLSRANFHVLEAEDGQSAVEVSTAYPGPIHLFLTDVVMPRLTGKLAAEPICKARPDMRVIFMSGYPRDTVINHGVCHDDIFFIQKPFAPKVLIEKVHHILSLPREALKLEKSLDPMRAVQEAPHPGRIVVDNPRDS